MKYHHVKIINCELKINYKYVVNGICFQLKYIIIICTRFAIAYNRGFVTKGFVFSSILFNYSKRCKKCLNNNVIN